MHKCKIHIIMYLRIMNLLHAKLVKHFKIKATMFFIPVIYSTEFA